MSICSAKGRGNEWRNRRTGEKNEKFSKEGENRQEGCLLIKIRNIDENCI